MLALTIPLSVVGLGFFCWLLYSLAVYALPLFIGLSTALWACGIGAGTPGATMLGLVVGAFVLSAGQMAFAVAPSPILRAVAGLTFAIPAALAGYHMTFAIAGLTVPADTWRHVFALLGSIAVGMTAWLRFAPMPANADGHRLPAGS